MTIGCPRPHPYRRRGRRGGNNRLRDDLSNDRINSDRLSEYIGISAPVHSMDGWSFLGRSIHCLSRGDPYIAVHLAYYAELRAALAILAAQGIGVFSYPHCVIDSEGRCNDRQARGRRRRASREPPVDLASVSVVG